MFIERLRNSMIDSKLDINIRYTGTVLQYSVSRVIRFHIGCIYVYQNMFTFLRCYKKIAYHIIPPALHSPRFISVEIVLCFLSD